MNTVHVRDQIRLALQTGGLFATETVQGFSEELGNLSRDEVSDKDIGTLFVEVIRDALLPACKVKEGGAAAACFTVHCAHFINNFWRLVRDDDDAKRRTIWNYISSAIPYFVGALDKVARRMRSLEATILKSSVVDSALELINNLIHYDHRAMDHMAPKNVQVLWRMYLVPLEITGEPRVRIRTASSVL